MQLNEFPAYSNLADNDLLLLWSNALSGTVTIKLSDLKTFLGSTSGGTSTSQTKSLVYASNGDTNGLFYWLGTSYGTVAWSNPHTSGQITLIASSSAKPIAGLVDRQITTWYSNNVAGSYVVFDIGVKRLLTITDLLLRHDDETGYYLRNFKVQGSNNVSSNDVTGISSATWVDLKSWTNDTTINAPNGWGRFSITGITQGYRWFKILPTGVNSTGDNYTVLGEIEVYGTLTIIQ